MSANSSISSPITVGHTIYAFKGGGMERGLLNIVNHGDSARFRHVILCLTEAGAFFDLLCSPSCKVVELHKKPGNDLRLPGRIAAAARQHELHVLHARGWPTLVETVLAARLAGVRATIYGFHGKTIEDVRGLSFRRRWMQKLFIRCYQHLVTLNSSMRAEFASECKLSEDQIQVIANGVDVDTFCPRQDKKSLRAAFKLPSDRFIIGNVARLDPVKNHEVILQALRYLRGHRCRPFFLLIGEGAHRAELEREIERLQVVNDVCLFGYSDHIPELLNCMDVYVQSSLYEGFSNTILEAMACGLPVIASAVGGTQDVVADGQEGLLFQSGDEQGLALAIARLYDDSGLRHSLSLQARYRAVQNFSVRYMTQTYEMMYWQLACKMGCLQD